MGHRTLAAVATLLAAGALVCQWTGLSYCGRSLVVRSAAVTAGTEQRIVAHAEADRILHDGRFVPVVGFVAAAVALGAATVARWRRKGFLTATPIVLLVFYAISLFVLV